MNEINKKAILIYAIGTFVPVALRVYCLESGIYSGTLISFVESHFITWTLTSWLLLAIERCRDKILFGRMLSHLHVPIAIWTLICFTALILQAAHPGSILGEGYAMSLLLTIMMASFDKIALTIYLLPFLFMFDKKNSTKLVAIQSTLSLILALLLTPYRF